MARLLHRETYGNKGESEEKALEIRMHSWHSCRNRLVESTLAEQKLDQPGTSICFFRPISNSLPFDASPANTNLKLNLLNK